MAKTGRGPRVHGAHSRPPTAVTPLRSGLQQLTDEQLLAKLSSLGVALDRESLGRLCEHNLGAVQVTQRLMDPTRFKGRGGQAQIHQIENCVAHLWQRWFPDQPSFDRLEDKMLAGYDLIEARDVAGACRVWLEGWAEALALLDRAGIPSLEELDHQFGGGEFVLNWLHALDQALWNAGLEDPQIFGARIALCEEGLRRFTASDPFFAETCRRALAESHFELGDTSKTDALYRQWLSADPQWGWGWSSWARCYQFARPEMKDLKRAEQILLEARSVAQVRDSDQLTQHLATLYEQQGRVQEAQQMLGPTPPSAATARSGPKVGRNEPCPCGSGKKFKKCCGSALSAT
jgi:tetratricopeptide (TPR) repeat protein